MCAVSRKYVVECVAKIRNAKGKAEQKADDTTARQNFTHHVRASGNFLSVDNICRPAHIKRVFGDYVSALIGVHADEIKRLSVVDTFGKMHANRTGGAPIVIDHFHAANHTAKVY